MKNFNNLTRRDCEERLIDIRHHLDMSLPLVVVSAKNKKSD